MNRVHLNGDEIAVRLSYLFWSAPPDEELRNPHARGASQTQFAASGYDRQQLLDLPFAATA